MTIAPAETTHRVRNGIGSSPIRPDGAPKVRGEFEFSGDIFEDGMLQEFILYEIGSKTSPHFIILLGEDTHDDLAEYVNRFVFRTPDSRHE